MLYVDMSIAKIIKICQRGSVTRWSVSTANKTNHENYESANKDKDRTPSTLFLFFIYSVLRLVCRESRPVSGDEEILVIEREYRLWFLLEQHIALAWISSRRAGGEI